MWNGWSWLVRNCYTEIVHGLQNMLCAGAPYKVSYSILHKAIVSLHFVGHESITAYQMTKTLHNYYSLFCPLPFITPPFRVYNSNTSCSWQVYQTPFLPMQYIMIEKIIYVLDYYIEGGILLRSSGNGVLEGKGGGGRRRWVSVGLWESNLLAGYHFIQYSLFCVLGGHGAMAPTSTPPHIPSLHFITAAGPLHTTGRQTSPSLVITHPAGKGIIVFVNIMCWTDIIITYFYDVQILQRHSETRLMQIGGILATVFVLTPHWWTRLKQTIENLLIVC